LGQNSEDYDKLVQHMLIASLLQDVGELPYQQATRHIYKPSYELRESVENSVGFDISSWNNKNIFTVACIYEKQIIRFLDGLCLPFLVFLITGYSNLDPRQRNNLLPLRHMMDGTVDADRLDYVFRDVHHTIGGLGKPNAVIESLLFYDETGPIFSDPGPVSNFLATRAYLYSTVYLAPANRFRVILLVALLQGIMRKDACAREFFGGATKGELSIEDFLELDDVSLTG
jgi:HD superfamily phosphohydrolase